MKANNKYMKDYDKNKESLYLKYWQFNNLYGWEPYKPLPKVKNKKVIRLMKAELGRNIMKEFVALRAKMYSYLTDSNNEDKIAKGTKKCVIKETFKFEDYEHCLEATQLENKINELEKTAVNGDSLKENHKEFIKK